MVTSNGPAAITVALNIKSSTLKSCGMLSSGEYDEQLGTIDIALQSSFAAAEFYGALRKAKGVLDLIVDLQRECTKREVDIILDLSQHPLVFFYNS